MKKALVGSVSALLLMEGFYFFWQAYAWSQLIRRVPLRAATVPSLQSGVESDAICGLLLVALAWAYGAGFEPVRRWLYVLSPVAIVYGYWFFHMDYPVMMSWKGLFERDLIALTVGSGIGFIAPGALLIVGRLSSGKS